MRALVLSGGGSKGAYQCGALGHIIGNLKVKYDILCGVSVGAINCGFLGQFSEGEEKESIERLTYLWDRLDTDKVYTRWHPFGRFHAIWQPSFYNSDPLFHLVKGCIDLEKIRSSGKQVRVGAISLSSGKYTIFGQDHDSFVDAIVASASFPGMLKPIKIGDQWWADGGVKEITPIKAAIELGATEVDVIMTSPETRVKFFTEKPSIVDIVKRVIDLSSDKIMSNDLEKAIMYNKLAGWGDPDRKNIKINLIRPHHNLIEDLLDFSPKKIQEMMKKGYDDASSLYKI